MGRCEDVVWLFTPLTLKCEINNPYYRYVLEQQLSDLTLQHRPDSIKTLLIRAAGSDRFLSVAHMMARLENVQLDISYNEYTDRRTNNIVSFFVAHRSAFPEKNSLMTGLAKDPEGYLWTLADAAP
ncbi:hypothetical protein BGZ93_009841 [Podila epicladia]|nr:hypothetical protein BGZ93_009841 [Podila epicladia]